MLVIYAILRVVCGMCSCDVCCVMRLYDVYFVACCVLVSSIVICVLYGVARDVSRWLRVVVCGCVWYCVFVYCLRVLYRAAWTRAGLGACYVRDICGFTSGKYFYGMYI